MVYGLLLGERILVFKSYCKCIFFVSKMVVLVKGMRGVVKNGRLLARMDVQCVCCVLKKYSQEVALAEKAGLHRSLTCMVERGGRNITIANYSDGCIFSEYKHE
jgi:hypothetical protein